MKKIIITVAVLVSCFNQRVVSQSTEQEYTRNAIYAELLGQGFLYSVNYDYRFTDHVCARVGFTHFTLEDFFFSDLTITAFPLMGEYLVGGGNHFLELGLGVIPLYSSNDFRFIEDSGNWGVVGTATVGYRYQPSDGGLLFRTGMPVFFTSTGAGVWGGVSIGYVF